LHPVMAHSHDPATQADFHQFAESLRADFRQMRSGFEQAHKELRSDFEQANKELRGDFEQAHKELRTDFGRVDRTVAGQGGELRMLKWSVGVGVAAILGGLGILYQGLTDLRSDMVRGDEALRVEIADLRERTIRLEEGQRYIQGRLQELIDQAHAHVTPPVGDVTSASPS